ncbi:MAG: hypothetical protein N2545_06085, partial [Thermoflexales bacterium]|nr:hypothetical protein [Thermoflexales bacterium]
MSKVVKATVAVAVSALATLIGLAQAQEGLLAPMPTPIPETLPPAAPTPTPPAQEGTRGEQEATFDPQWVLWTPSSSVTFTVPYRQGQPSPITVRVSSDEGGLITSTARFVLAIDGIIGPEQPAVATSVVGTTTLDLTADIGNAPTGSLIR